MTQAVPSRAAALAGLAALIGAAVALYPPRGDGVTAASPAADHPASCSSCDARHARLSAAPPIHDEVQE